MSEPSIEDTGIEAWSLGDLRSSEQLIRDLYISLRDRILMWSAITQQTPQARMGYVGQHLVSVVTGIPGGKTGARGHDLIFPDSTPGEIKTCYRIDQLGVCAKCEARVASIEERCSVCDSETVIRSDDSKWLIATKSERDFSKILEPKRYFFVLFEFEDIISVNNNRIVASIWEVDPRTKGFVYALVDHAVNITSGAPFNFWPYSAKFYMSQPKLIYRSIIDGDEIDTLTFPGEISLSPARDEKIPALVDFSKARTFTVSNLSSAVAALGEAPARSKPHLIVQLEELRKGLSNQEFADLLAEAVYVPLIRGNVDKVPASIRDHWQPTTYLHFEDEEQLRD